MFFYTFMPKLFNMSLTASVAIVLVILLRLLLKKAPKVISYALWGVVLFRLLCPVSIGSSFSLYNLFDAPIEESGAVTSVIEYVPSNIVHTEYPSVALPVPGISDVINEALPQGQEQLVADPLEAPMSIATYVWMIGVLGMVIYSIVSYVRLRRKLSVVVPLRDNIFIADDIKSPFVVGLFRPKIYLPCNLGDKEQEYIILHEQHHIKRLDHVMKALAFLALAIHWFNPLVWVAFILASKDMEMSCDEAVIRKVDSDVRADYSASLLTLATGRRIIAGTPLAFGEGDTKGRISNLSKWKKPAVWVVLIAVVACIVLAVSLLTNPSDNKLHAPEPFCHSYRVKTIMYQDTRYSFGYTMDTAPRYQLTSDYQLFVAGDTFDGSEASEWVQHHGAFKEIKLSGLRFDDYLKDPGNLSGWDGARYGAESIREQTKQAWRLEVDGNENGVFYYLILTHTDKVFLCYGYNTGDTYAAAEEDSLIRWVFELERTDLLTCNALSEKLNSFVELECFPDTDIEQDTEHWPVAYINESGVLQFSLEGDTDTLVVSEDYYRKSENSTFIERNTFEITRNDDGFFTIDIARRESLDDHVNYFIKIKGQSDVYVMKVVFDTVPIGGVANPVSAVTEWFDYLETPEEMNWDGSVDINLPEFPDVTFRWTYGEIVAIKGNKTTSLYTGMPIWNTYFCDLSGDGLPELCSTISWGSGMIDNRVIIYDYANGVSYSLEERGVSDYTLRQNESDGQLYVDKTAHMGGGLLSTGRLVFEDDCLQVLWPEKPNDNISEITDPTDDPNFAYDTAVEKIYEDERNEYFISGLYSQYIIVHYTDGIQEDIVTALNAGRATFADLDKFGIRYWAEPKGVISNTPADEFYLTIGADGVKSIELSMPNSSGGCENADGSLFKKGERIWLENLDGYSDLCGLTITALGVNGEVIWTASIPATDENKGFTHLINDGWEITNIE